MSGFECLICSEGPIDDSFTGEHSRILARVLLGFPKNLNDETEESTASLELELFQRGTYCLKCTTRVNDLCQLLQEIEELEKMVVYCSEELVEKLKQSFDRNIRIKNEESSNQHLRQQIIFAIGKEDQQKNRRTDDDSISDAVFEEEHIVEYSGQPLDSQFGLTVNCGNQLADISMLNKINKNEDISEEEAQNLTNPSSPTSSLESSQSFEEKFDPFSNLPSQEITFTSSPSKTTSTQHRIQDSHIISEIMPHSTTSSHFHLRLGTSSKKSDEKMLEKTLEIENEKLQERKPPKTNVITKFKNGKRCRIDLKRERDNTPRIPCPAPHCGFTFIHGHQIRLKMHIQECHEGIKECLECDECQQVFDGPKSLEIHKKFHKENGSTFYCRICGETFDTYVLMKSHYSKEHPVFKCSKCPMTYSNQSDLNLHLENHPSRPQFICIHCNKSFVNRPGLFNHYKIVHPSGDSSRTPLPCGECSRTFHLQSYLEHHIKLVHKKEYKFQCEKCGYVCLKNNDLSKHIRLKHSDIRNFHCRQCDAKYKTKPSLDVHMRKHTGERPFQCCFCPKRFLKKYTLQNHEAIHAGEQPRARAQCEFCKKFYVKDYLNCHIKTYHKEQSKQMG